MELDEILRAFEALPAETQAVVARDALEATKGKKWIPNPGPQTEAYYSEADCLLYGGEPGGGKLLALDTPIPTPEGWATMGDIEVGATVFDEHGMPCRVVAKSDVETEDTYLLTFSDGSQVVAGARHQWVTSTRKERMRALRSSPEWRAKRRAGRELHGNGKRPDLATRNRSNAGSKGLPTSGVRTTREIAESLRGRDGRLNHSVVVAGAIELPRADLPIDPYTFGVWLGDGTSTSGAVTSADHEVFDAIEGAGYTTTTYARSITRGVLGLQADLRALNVLGNKHIPAIYLRGSVDQRLALLQGLMDADGHCDRRGQCEIQLTSKALIDGVYELLCSLGIKVQMREGVARLNGRDIGPKWRIKFLTHHQAFRLPRKAERQKRDGFRGTHDVRYIVSADVVDPMPMQCIQVDSPSHCYLAGAAMIPTHNSQLILGLAFNEHQRTLVMRREYADLDRLIEDALAIHGSRDGFNGSPPPRLRINEKQVINFRAAQRVGDEQGTMGQGRDLLAIDEATHFAESQIRFLMGWVRSEDPDQRCRTVLATNPPLSAEGLWVNKMFAPWIDPKFPYPAQPGELRWVISDSDGNDKWVDGPGEYEVEVAGVPKMVRATSRSYIPASVRDNPYYVDSDYEATLDALSEPYRSLLMGGFKTAFEDQDFQVIPTEWVTAAQARWTPDGWKEHQMTAMGLDPAGGGRDSAELAYRHGGWYGELVSSTGEDTKDGAKSAATVVEKRRHGAPVVIDVGGGYAGAVIERFKDNGIDHLPFNGGSGSTAKTKDGELRFYNKRAEAWWKFREELDPSQEGGSVIALPPDQELLADLTAPTFTIKTQGILLEPKDDIRKRIGRSPGKGDAVVMALSEGNKAVSRAFGGSLSGRKPRVVTKRDMRNRGRK